VTGVQTCALPIYHLLISGDLLSNVSAQIQIAPVEILELPDASLVNWPMTQGTVPTHIVVRVDSEWRGLMRSMFDLLTMKFSGSYGFSLLYIKFIHCSNFLIQYDQHSLKSIILTYPIPQISLPPFHSSRPFSFSYRHTIIPNSTLSI
jgi:hypothetical protein